MGSTPPPPPEPSYGGAHGLPDPPHINVGNVPFLPGQFPVPMQDLFNNHLAALGQQLPTSQFPAGGTNGPLGVPHVHNGQPLQQIPLFPQPQPPNFQQFLAQQQQVRAAAGHHGVGSGTPAPSEHPQPPNLPRNQGAPDMTNHPQNNNNASYDPSNVGTVVQEGQGPNGTSWRVVINQSTASYPLPSINSQTSSGVHLPHGPVLHNPHIRFPQANPAFNPARLPQLPSLSQGGPPHFMSAPSSTPSLASPLSSMLQRMATMEATLENGEAPTELEILDTRIQLLNLTRQQNILPAVASQLGSRLDDLSNRATLARARTTDPLLQPTAETSSNVPQSSPSSETTVYLLSSPSGPQALLISPAGLYSTSGLGSPLPNSHTAILHPQPNNTFPGYATAATNVARVQPVAAGRDAHAAAQQPHPDQARDLLRILLPLGGHLWLLIRLFGFVYFVTGGAGWYRTILLGTCAILIFLSQTQIFRPLQQAVWEPFRRHVEGILPLGGNEGVNRPNVQREGPEGQAPAGAEPSPRQMAERLLQEREQHGGSIVRRNLRRAERAVALFVASLVPGVGERHIAARDAAEAARAAEQREREERVRLEEEARQRDEDDNARGTADSIGHGDGEAEGEHFLDAEEGLRPGHEPAAAVAEQPLVEI